MRVERVLTHCLDHELTVPFESASGRFERRQHCLVEVICDDGTVGWGECLGPPPLNAAAVGAYAGLLIGRDPLATDVRWLELYHALRDQGQRGVTMTALSGIDIALWDIKGKHFGVPVSTLMGGRFRDTVQAYATGGFRPDGPDRSAATAAEIARYVAEGFTAVKIKIGFGYDEDLAAIGAVRDAIGPDVRLMIDANHGYDAPEAIEVGRAAARFDIDWFEEPVIPEEPAVYARVRAAQPLPLAGGETWHGRHGMRQALEAGAVDILQPDVCGTGGFSEMRRIVDMAGLYGVRVVPHVWGSGIALAASLHCLAALPFQPPRPKPQAPMLEFDRTPNPIRQAVLRAPIEHEQGWVRVPEGAGLGIEIDRDALSRYAWAEKV
ncbi:mandelate racemase/muconate lactonizing enzyme family protein [Salinisphaera sp. LB1]|uniref:mandelate racemase/muconate lactonizing enzyme family protein n=1 Tax=Salinisphaera sp. LB1 TaxID=2183911 RepID=UPI000D706AC4|nr:mandelate racemase/muconate lactonizing enzyme family protein [Salinisphaera sp. LB1]AWN14677.1 L-alanine-DL-glutamate epimerase and related enzymes of enolase superfamily [Salinisphaera sp. LB1]